MKDSGAAGIGRAPGAHPERRVLFVVPRLVEAGGGSERLLSEIAVRLAAREDFAVEIATTCATSDATWENVLPEGRSVVDGIVVRRFATRPPSAASVGRTRRLLSRPRASALLDRLGWRPATVASPALADFLRATRRDWDAVVAAPCVHGTTATVVSEVPERAVLVPCLHDEPEARLPSTGRMLRAASRRLFNTVYERDLARRLHGDEAARGPVVGLGFDVPADVAPEAEVRERFGIEGDFLVHVGRAAPGKGVDELVALVRAHALAQPAEAVGLVLAGAGRRPAEIAPGIRHLGWVDERTKHGLVAASLSHASFSRMESLSIALHEAWLLGTPAIVGADSGLLAWQVGRSGGGIAIRTPEDLAAALRCLREPGRRAALAEAGARLVREEHAWDRVLGAFVGALPTFPATTSR